MLLLSSDITNSYVHTPSIGPNYYNDSSLRPSSREVLHLSSRGILLREFHDEDCVRARRYTDELFLSEYRLRKFRKDDLDFGSLIWVTLYSVKNFD